MEASADGKTTRLSALLQVEKTTGRTPPELANAPAMPDGLDYLWRIYIDIKSGTDQISYSEIHSYCHLNGMLDNWEVQAIRAIEHVRRSHG